MVAAGEGRSLEFKSGLPRDEKAARTLCAFANTRGGVLLIGVLDNGRLVGAGNVDETVARVEDIAHDRVDPPARIEIEVVRCERVPIICVSVPLSGERPHAVRHDDGSEEIVVRVGSSNRVADGATLKALRSRRPGRGTSDALERRILAWVQSRERLSDRPGGDATVAGFAKAQNIGLQRARRAFVNLEQRGELVAFGWGGSRVYSRP